jgi:hypothetical protein
VPAARAPQTAKRLTVQSLRHWEKGLAHYVLSLKAGESPATESRGSNWSRPSERACRPDHRPARAGGTAKLRGPSSRGVAFPSLAARGRQAAS